MKIRNVSFGCYYGHILAYIMGFKVLKIVQNSQIWFRMQITMHNSANCSFVNYFFSRLRHVFLFITEILLFQLFREKLKQFKIILLYFKPNQNDRVNLKPTRYNSIAGTSTDIWNGDSLQADRVIQHQPNVSLWQTFRFSHKTKNVVN